MEASGDLSGGLAPTAPLTAEEVVRTASFGEEAMTFRSVDFGTLGQVLSESAVAAQEGPFFKQAQTSFRSVVVHQGTDQVGPLLLSRPEGFVPVSDAKATQLKAQLRAAQTPVVILGDKAPAVDITVSPLPKSPVFELEPVSTFRVCQEGAPQLPSCVDSVLREVLSCGVEQEASTAKWRCVHSSAFSYVTFVVTVYSDGFDESGKLMYVVEAQRRSGNVQDFFALYRAMRETVSATASGAADSPVLASPLSSRKRVLPPPPPSLLASLGMDLKQMHVASFKELLRLEADANLINGHREAVRALAEMTLEDGACAALNEEAEDEEGGNGVALRLSRRLVALLAGSDVETASYAANALAELSKHENLKAIIVKCRGVPALANAAVAADSCDEVGLRRGSGAAVANLAATDVVLSHEDVTAVHRFVVTAEASDDKVLSGFAREAQTALGLTC